MRQRRPRVNQGLNSVVDPCGVKEVLLHSNLRQHTDLRNYHLVSFLRNFVLRFAGDVFEKNQSLDECFILLKVSQNFRYLNFMPDLVISILKEDVAIIQII